MKKLSLLTFASLLIIGCSSEPEIPADQLTMVDDVIISEDGEQLKLSVVGNHLNGCEMVDETLVKTSGKTTTIQVTKKSEGEMCIQALMPYIENISIDKADLASGENTFIVNGMEKSFTLP